MSRPRNSKIFTEDQIQQHSHLQDLLQKANAEAAQTLIALRAFGADEKRTRHISTDLANVVRWMNSLIECCELVVDSASQQNPTTVLLIFGLTCEHCEDTGRSVNGSGAQNDTGTLAVDPVWGKCVTNLLLLAISTICRTCAGSALGKFKESQRCLADLSKALRRQQRHLARIGGKHTPKIVVMEDDSEVCSECGHPKTSGPLVGGD